MGNQPKPCGQYDAYVNPYDRVDIAGRVFSTLKIYERYGIPFERWLTMVETGEWYEIVG